MMVLGSLDGPSSEAEYTISNPFTPSVMQRAISSSVPAHCTCSLSPPTTKRSTPSSFLNTSIMYPGCSPPHARPVPIWMEETLLPAPLTRTKRGSKSPLPVSTWRE